MNPLLAFAVIGLFVATVGGGLVWLAKRSARVSGYWEYPEWEDDDE